MSKTDLIKDLTLKDTEAEESLMKGGTSEENHRIVPCRLEYI